MVKKIGTSIKKKNSALEMGGGSDLSDYYYANFSRNGWSSYIE